MDNIYYASMHHLMLFTDRKGYTHIVAVPRSFKVDTRTEDNVGVYRFMADGSLLGYEFNFKACWLSRLPVGPSSDVTA